MIRRPPRSTRTDTLFPYTTLFRSCASLVIAPKQDSKLKHIEFVPLNPGRALVVLVTEDGEVENRLVQVPLGLPASVFMEATNYLNRSEEHTSELQSLMRISYAVFCLKKKNKHIYYFSDNFDD